MAISGSYFKRNPEVESLLDSMKIKWEFEEGIPLEELTPEWENQNNCRRSAIVDESFSYAERMQAGSKAPAGVVTRTPQGVYIVDGRQRIYAVDLNGGRTFDAYVLIKPTTHQLQVLSPSLNQLLNGVRADKSYAMDIAVNGYVSGEFSLTEAVHASGQKKAVFQSALNTRQVRDVIIARGYTPQLANGALAAFAKFKAEPDLLVEACKALDEADATIQISNQLASMIDEKKGRARKEAIAEWKELPEVDMRLNRRKTRKRFAKETAFLYIRSLHTTLKNKAEECQIQMRPSEKEEFAKLANYCINKIRVICGEQWITR